MAGPAEIVLGFLAVDVCLGHIAEKTLEPGLDAAVRALKSVLLTLWDPAFATVRLNLQEHISRMSAEDADFVEKLRRSLGTEEGAALVAHFLREAAQATTEERMRMLAAAAAGVFVPDLDSDMRSRVARAVAQLEPADALLLRDMEARFRVGSSSQEAFGSRLARSHGALQATGCIVFETQHLSDALVSARRRRTDPELRTFAHVTAVGRAVLRALERWAPSGPKRAAP